MNDHDEDATAEQLPGRERRRLQTSRLVQYLLLQAVIAGACVLALLQSLPGPSRPVSGHGVQAHRSRRRARGDAAVFLPVAECDERSAPLQRTIRSPGRRSRAGLVGVSAALYQRRRGHRQRRRDPRQPARSRRQPSRPQHAGDRGDPRVGAARRRQRDFDPAVHLGPDHRLSRSHLGRPGRVVAPEL